MPLTIAAAAALLLFSTVTVAGAQTITALDSGESVYRAACAACHGPDGRGAAPLTVGFEVPLPDFTDCSFNSREPAADWFAISHDGGPARAFDRRMPAFGQALTAPQIETAVAHIKRFCEEPAWPAGELNLPRALVTEKAFPEDEAVLSTRIASGTIVNEFLYARLPPQPRKRAHLRRGRGDDVGVRVPVNESDSRRTQVLTYFLWDWFDGGLFDGWR